MNIVVYAIFVTRTVLLYVSIDQFGHCILVRVDFDVDLHSSILSLFDVSL